MTTPTPDEIRAATFQAARDRLDVLRGGGKGGGPAKDKRLGGKTTKTPKCKPPNRLCGSRCIPPNWNCRVSGGGLDSHSRVVAWDPVGGIGGIWRGGKNVKKGIEKGDPELVTRGVKGIERGITKLTPGDDLEKKQRFRKNLKTASTIAGLGLVSFLALRKGHRMANRSPWYRDNVGRKIDQAVYRSRERMYNALDRVPLLRGNRQRPMAPGTTAELLNQMQGSELASHTARHEDPRRARILSGRIVGGDPLANEISGLATVHATDNRANRDNLGENEWMAAKGQRLFSLRRGAGTPPGSAYSEPATHELLAQQFGFQLDPQGIRRGHISSERQTVQRHMTQHLTAMHESLVGDMRARGLNPDRPQDRDTFIQRFIGEHPLRLPGIPEAEATRQSQIYERNVGNIVHARTARDRARMTRELYNETRGHFDNYFATAASRLQGSERAGSELAHNSPVNDMRMALARMHAGNGFGTRPQNLDHANLLNHVYYDTQVRGRRHSEIAPNRAVRVAAALQSVPMRSLTPDQAVTYLNANGLPQVRLTQTAQRPIGRNNAPSASPEAGRPAGRRPAARQVGDILRERNADGTPRYATRAAAEAEYRRRRGERGGSSASPARQSAAAAARERAYWIREYQQQGGLSEEAAIRAYEQRRRRERNNGRGDAFDALPPRIAAYLDTLHRLDAGKGKPCGDSFIAAGKKCGKRSITESGQHTQGLADKHDNAYRARQLASVVARVGLTGAMGALAYKAGRDALNAAPGNARANLVQTALGAGVGALLGVASLKREAAVTHDTKQLQDRVEKLKQHDGVESETIDKLSKFMGDVDLDSQRVPTMTILAGAAGYFDSAHPDRVYVVGGFGTHKKTVHSKDELEALTKGTAQFMEDRAKLSPRQQDARNVTNPETMRENFAVSGYIGNSKAQSTALILHETAHAMHYRSNFASPKYVTVNGKKYEGKELEDELMRSSSIYGQSDLRRARTVEATNYYTQGNRLETFTENYILYATNGKKMKELYPVSYAWTKATADYALSFPPKKPAKPFVDVLGDIGTGTDRFEPPSKRRKARRDAPEDGAQRFFDLYQRMQTAALAGNLRQATLVLAEAQALPLNQRQMVAALLETAALYALEDGEGGKGASRGDAAPPAGGKGKPCGASFIPKGHNCGKGASSAPPEGGKAPAAQAAKPAATPSNLKRNLAIGAAAAAIAAVGVTGLVVARDAKRFYANTELPPPIGYRDAVKLGKGGDLKVKHDVALGKYYDDVVAKQGWKAGELVYTAYPKSKNGPSGPTGAHFAVYMGKQDGKHQFAEVIVDAANSREGFVNISDVGPGAKRMPPMIYTKAPPVKGEARPYTPEQISKRIYSSLGSKMRYDKLDNNCESWARMIVTGQPRSTQADRLSKVTKTLFGAYDNLGAPKTGKGVPDLKQYAKRLDLYQRINSGDKAAVQELRTFESLLKAGKRTDSPEDGTSLWPDLPTPKELLAGAVSDADVVLRTKHYLMLIVAAIQDLPEPARTDAAGEKRVGKPCGASHIAKSLKCEKSGAESAQGHDRAKKVALAVAGVGLAAGAAYLFAKYGFTTKDKQEFEDARAHTHRVQRTVSEPIDNLAQIGRGADGKVYVSKDGKTVFKVAHNPENIMREVQFHIKAQTAGVSTAQLQAYDPERGIIKMEALGQHKPLASRPMSQAARHKAGVALLDNFAKLHSNGLMHGDVHPRNLLVDKIGDLRLIDFGHAYLSKKPNEHRSEFRTALELAHDTGLVSPDTYKKSLELLIDVRLKRKSYDTVVPQILDLVKAGKPPAKWKPKQGGDVVRLVLDAADSRRGKPCGASHISKAKQCNIGKAQEGSALLGGDGRNASQTLLSTTALHDRLSRLKDLPDADPRIIEQLTKFVQSNGITADKLSRAELNAGTAGFFHPQRPNVVQVSDNMYTHRSSFKGRDELSTLAGAASAYMDARSRLPERKLDARAGLSRSDMYEQFAVGTWAGTKEAALTCTILHETAHAAHYRSGFTKVNSVTVNGKTYTGDVLAKELMRSTSIYGQSDMYTRLSSGKETYYIPANRKETFAENYVLYALAGNKMKEMYPVSYAWTRAIADSSFPKSLRKDSLAKSNELSLQKASKTVVSGKANFDRLYDAMQAAANTGDVISAERTLRQAATLPLMQRQMIAALLETAYLNQ